MIITDLVASLKQAEQLPRIILASPKMPLPSLKSNVRSRMVKAYKKYKRGGNIGDLSLSMRSALDSAYAEAYMIGKKSNSISKRELKWINKQKREQFGYLDGFMSDLDAGTSVMPPVDRISAYLKKLDGMYWSGYVAGAADGSQLHWRLSPDSNNCEDCEDYAAASPYNRDELEAVPGDGSTACKFNCNCFLEVVQ